MIKLPKAGMYQLIYYFNRPEPLVVTALWLVPAQEITILDFRELYDY
jgi:hypothetical protein